MTWSYPVWGWAFNGIRTRFRTNMGRTTANLSCWEISLAIDFPLMAGGSCEHPPPPPGGLWASLQAPWGFDANNAHASE